MEKRDKQYGLNLSYDEQGSEEVTEQIMDSYNSGVIEQRVDDQFTPNNAKTEK